MVGVQKIVYQARPMTIEGPLIRAARALLEIDQRGLAELAGLTERTVVRAENGRVSAATQAAIREALERRGIDFIFENEVGVGVRRRTKRR
jgi:DNA-binding XRE family transcriptional regulator